MTFSVQSGGFSYGKRIILQDIRLEVKQGTILAILGPNGVGKTTLLRCMMGLLPWEKGSTYLDGNPLKTYRSSEFWKKVGYVPQAKDNAASLSVREMVLLGRSAHLGLFYQPKETDWEEADKALNLIGLEHLSLKPCNKLSGGELQMVLIARALCSHPQLLVLDEPESNLDFRNQLNILNTLKRLKEQNNISAIINTHYPVHALQVADQALLLNKDHTHAYGSCNHVITEETMEKTFGVEVKITQIEHQGCQYKAVVPLSIKQAVAW